MKYITLWSDRPYSPYVMKNVVEATVDGLNKIFPNPLKKGGVYWQNGIVEYFYPKNQLEKAVDKLARKSLKNPDFLYKLSETAYQKANKLKKYTDKYIKENKGADYRKNIKFLKKVAHLFKNMYKHGTVSILLGYRDDNLIYQEINRVLSKKLKNQDLSLSEALLILSNPPKRLIPQDQELALLKLAKKAKKENLSTKKKIKSRLKKELEKITEKFGWLSYDYCDKIYWDFNYYADLVYKKCKQNNLNDLIRKNINYEEKTEQEYNNLIKILKLKPQEKKLFDLIRAIGYYKFLRGQEFQKSLYDTKLIQDKVAQHFNLSSLSMKFIMDDEFDDFLNQPQKYKKITQMRYNNFLFLARRGQKYQISRGPQAKYKFDKMDFFKYQVSQQQKIIKGMPAHSGLVEGVVKIVNKEKEIKKIKKNNVMVSIATNPNLLPAMKKSLAIITDEGGITCHAAIVSRELGKPCVVGTKIATQVLKDGDKVEVDANKGVIRKLKK